METTTLQRLLKYPHAAVFDKAPGAELAFLLRHPDVAAWRVADRRLVITVDDVETAYALADFNVGELADRLQDDGFEVTHLTTEYRYLSALALVEGDGSQLVSNGDQVHVFTSLLWVILSCYAAEVMHAAEQVQQALRQMVITTSEGEWLDLWGSLYADARRPGESDANYAERIPVEAFRIRENPRAIKIAIKDATGFDVRIDEPWTNMFRLDESTLSGPDKFYDGQYVGYHLIQPRALGAINWPAVLEVINRNRAAGVLVLGPQITYPSWVDASGAFVHFAMVQELPSVLRYEDRAFLDTGPLEEVSIPNHPARYRREMRRLSHVVVDQDNYAVHARAKRDYRSYQSGSEYEGQYWGVPQLRTWAAGADNSWGTSAVVGSRVLRDEGLSSDADLVFSLDAKAYASGQTWANGVAAPADGSAQQSYDYYLGSTSSAAANDPTINAAGTDGAYWSFDGGDYFTHTLSPGAMPAFIKNLHKAGSKFTILVWMRWSGVSAGEMQPLFDSGSGDHGGSYTSRGVVLDIGRQLTPINSMKLYVTRDSGGTRSLSKVADTVLPADVTQMIAASIDGTGASNSFFYRDGAYEKVDGLDTWDGAFDSPGTNDPSQPSRIGTRGDGYGAVPNGTRLYLMRVYKRNLTKAELDAIWNGTKGRFGL